MKTSIKSWTIQNLCRYSFNCTLRSPFSPKTLKPNTAEATVPCNLLIKISSLCHYSSGSSLIFSSELYPLQKGSILSASSCGSSFVLQFGLHSSNCFSKPYLPIKNRYLINSPNWYSIPTSLAHNSYSVYPSYGWPHCENLVRYCTMSSSCGRFSSNNFSHKLLLEIVDILRNDKDDLESRLNILHPRLCRNLITEIFNVLNCQRISGLRFFEWIRVNNPQLHKNAHVCSLIIDNVGRLEDYVTMNVLFKKFTSEKICISYEAFKFLPIWACNDSSLEESTKRVVDLLKGVGGSCCSSGICALIEMFCKLHLFEMANYVIKITESKMSYYCLLIREKCRSDLIEDAYDIIKEMRQSHCTPNTTAYNYVLGSLWKNGRMDEASTLLDEMKENGIPSDSITFEILICSACSVGSMDVVRQLLDQMWSQGLEPRMSTFAFIIKTLFASEKYELAHKYVIDLSFIYKTSSNMMYSLLASLYQEKGDLMNARNTLVEMMEDSLKPNFSIYVKIVKRLRVTGKANLAEDLEIRHSKFVIKSDAGLA